MGSNRKTSVKALLELFETRDRTATDEFNDKGVYSLESRLTFAEDRLRDLASTMMVVSRILAELDDQCSKSTSLANLQWEAVEAAKPPVGILGVGE